MFKSIESINNFDQNTEEKISLPELGAQVFNEKVEKISKLDNFISQKNNFYSKLIYNKYAGYFGQIWQELTKLRDKDLRENELNTSNIYYIIANDINSSVEKNTNNITNSIQEAKDILKSFIFDKKNGEIFKDLSNKELNNNFLSIDTYDIFETFINKKNELEQKKSLSENEKKNQQILNSIESLTDNKKQQVINRIKRIFENERKHNETDIINNSRSYYHQEKINSNNQKIFNKTNQLIAEKIGLHDFKIIMENLQVVEEEITDLYIKKCQPEFIQDFLSQRYLTSAYYHKIYPENTDPDKENKIYYENIDKISKILILLSEYKQNEQAPSNY